MHVAGPSRVSALIVAALTAIVACAGCGGDTGPTPPTSAPQLLVSFASQTVVGGLEVSGTVSLSPVPAAETVVNLVSSNGSVSVPATVTIAGGATTASFSATTSQVSASLSATVTASITSTNTIGSTKLGVTSIPTCGPFLTAPVMMPFPVYIDNGDERNHFIPSGFFGDTQDLSVDTADRNPHTGSTAIRIQYTPRGPQHFAGVYWQCPENNWGTFPDAGFNLSRAREIQFWARASTPTQAEFKVGGIGRGSTPFPDSFGPTPDNTVLFDVGTNWRMYTIDVSRRDLTHVIGGMMFVTNTTQNPSGITLFLDDIVWQ